MCTKIGSGVADTAQKFPGVYQTWGLPEVGEGMEEDTDEGANDGAVDADEL